MRVWMHAVMWAIIGAGLIGEAVWLETLEDRLSTAGALVAMCEREVHRQEIQHLSYIMAKSPLVDRDRVKCVFAPARDGGYWVSYDYAVTWMKQTDYPNVPGHGSDLVCQWLMP